MVKNLLDFDFDYNEEARALRTFLGMPEQIIDSDEYYSIYDEWLYPNTKEKLIQIKNQMEEAIHKMEVIKAIAFKDTNFTYVKLRAAVEDARKAIKTVEDNKALSKLNLVLFKELNELVDKYEWLAYRFNKANWDYLIDDIEELTKLKQDNKNAHKFIDNILSTWHLKAGWVEEEKRKMALREEEQAI